MIENEDYCGYNLDQTIDLMYAHGMSEDEIGGLLFKQQDLDDLSDYEQEARIVAALESIYSNDRFVSIFLASSKAVGYQMTCDISPNIEEQFLLSCDELREVVALVFQGNVNHVSSAFRTLDIEQKPVIF